MRTAKAFAFVGTYTSVVKKHLTTAVLFTHKKGSAYIIQKYLQNSCRICLPYLTKSTTINGV